MSFLGQLRQSAGRAAETMQLVYLIQIDAAQIKLRLALAEFRQSELLRLLKMYTVEPRHLQVLPAFYRQVDRDVISALQRALPTWLGDSWINIAEVVTVDELATIIDTGRAYFQRGEQRLELIRTAEPVQAKVSWRVESDGGQTLTWTVPPDWQVFGIPGASFALSPKGDLHRLISPALEGETVLGLGKTLSVEDVDDYLQGNGVRPSTDRDLLPRALPEKRIEGRLVSQLLCETVNGESRCYIQHWYETKLFAIKLDRSNQSMCLRQWIEPTLWEIRRDPTGEEKREAQVAALMRDFGHSQRGWHSAEREQWRALLIAGEGHLANIGVMVVFRSNFQFAYCSANQWAVELSETDGNVQVSIQVEAAGQRFDGISLLGDVIRENLNYIRVGEDLDIQVGGFWLSLPSQLIGRLSDEFADLLVPQGAGLLPPTQQYRLGRLKTILPEATGWSDTHGIVQQAERLHELPSVLDQKSVRINAQLRPYQWLGVYWLQHLTRLGYGGLLADDMGLGKTLQTLTHLSIELAGDVPVSPALIVVPKSLIGNWINELNRFCPHLKVMAMHGSTRERRWSQIQHHHVVVTSYALLVRDFPQWADVKLSWLVLDEAQTIKNPSTQVSQCMRQLTAQHRLCLTGTPVENHLLELWSMMDFLNPGVLGSQQQFKKVYQKPIEQEYRTQRMEQLLSRISPFMIRRTKSQVAKELPEKTIVEKRIALSREHMQYYDEVKQEQWRMALDDSDDSVSQRQIKLLTAITKLRQVACDPSLLGESLIASAKTETCLEMVEELVAEKRCVLIFSQFTKMLRLLADQLDYRGLDYFELTGQTQNRQDLVARFQDGERPVFLISLKAGGVGLNLTRADTVIHFDPWWNQAAENQASDRAHRIGQTQAVFVYKLVAEHTIEERVLDMQSAKAWLSDTVNIEAQNSEQKFVDRLKALLK